MSDSSTEAFIDLDEFEEEVPYFPSTEPDSSYLAAYARREKEIIAKSIDLLPSQFVSFAMRMPNAYTGILEDFSFEGRRHMYKPYDSPARRILLVAARQVEKSVVLSTRISMADGTTKLAKDITVGDVVCTLSGDGVTMTTGVVTWVSGTYQKPCVRLITTQNRSVDVAITHPMRVPNAWKEAGCLRVHDLVAAVVGHSVDSPGTVVWDSIHTFAGLGDLDCVDFEVEGTHNFVANGLITHNSTLCGNLALSYCCTIPSYKVLYVSPSATQTKTFSADRLKEPMDTSDVLTRFSTGLLAKNIFEKQFINRSKITLRYAYLTADRCVTGDTRVYFTDGSVAQVLDVFKTPATYVGKRVWAVDPLRKEVASAPLEGVVSQGERSVYLVRFYGGVELRCTANQPLLTWDGWKTLDELSVGSWVAAPLRIPHGTGVDAPVEEFRLAGYLLGNGSMRHIDNVTFCTSNTTVLADFQYCVTRLGAPLGKLEDCNRKHWVNKETKTQRIGGGRTGYKKRLEELGLVGTVHNTKHVPTSFFMGSKVQITEFLRALYATDGWASVAVSGQFEIGYSSNSRQLLVDVKHLLMRFGIQAVISKQKKPSTDAALGGYTISIRHSLHVVTFCDEIGIIGKEGAVAQVRSAASKVTRVKQDFDRIPMSYAELKAYVKDKYGLSTHAAWERYQIQLRPDGNKDTVGRNVLATIGTKLSDKHLQELANSGIGWVKLESKESVGTELTYDLSITGLENYLSDGLFVHNTRGIPAFMLILDEIQDILYKNIPVIEQCTSHAPEQFKKYVYAGTPKSLDNTIEYFRSRYSTQGEWVVPCDACGSTAGSGRYWNILGEKNIGKKSLICEKCGKALDPMHPDAQWANMVEYQPEKEMYQSFRIPQLMVPWKPWGELLHQYETYPRAQFYNEVLGISFDSGMRPLNLSQVKEHCVPSLSMHPDDLKKYEALSFAQPIFMGVDWGCHDDKTRILTENGFKYFCDLTDEDKVAQWDPRTRKMTFVTPLARTVRDWNEPLLHFSTEGALDLMVTHTHRMRVTNAPRDRWVTESAGETACRSNNTRFVGYVGWEGEEQQTFVLPGLPGGPGYSGSEDRVFRMDDWVEFVGYLVTEAGVCFARNRPNCVKMSQRVPVNQKTADRIKKCMASLDIKYSEFPNAATGDLNWTIHGKQYWQWYADNIGVSCDEKRLPRELLVLSCRQLRILFDALVAGDGTTDARDNRESGAFYSTSKGLCEDFQEVCIRLGMRCSVGLHKEAEGKRKARWRAVWSRGRDFTFNTPSAKVKRVPYEGKVYCCAVPTGYIVTERNGRVAYQGNTAERTYTVVTLGTYAAGNKFRVFFMHRFTGKEAEPDEQLRIICELVQRFNVAIIATDYGGGFDRNDHLMRKFGPQRLHKFQYMARSRKKVEWDGKLMRWKINRTEIMSDIFNGIKRGIFEFPRWEEFNDPFATDMCNIFSEYNETLRMIQYAHTPDRTDDSFHSLLYCFIGSMLKVPRPDVITPRREEPGRGALMTTDWSPVNQG